MTLHFAAARSARLSPIARALARRAAGWPANDNGGAHLSVSEDGDAMLRAALRHFAAHGLGAARAAQAEAERAWLAGDGPRYERWLGVCRTLDRRLAARLAHRHGQSRTTPR